MSINCRKISFAISLILFLIIAFTLIVFITSYLLISKTNQNKNVIMMIPNKHKNHSSVTRDAQSTSILDGNALISFLQKLLSLFNPNLLNSLNLRVTTTTKRYPIISKWKPPIQTPLPPSRPMIHGWFRTTTNRPLPFNEIKRCGMVDSIRETRLYRVLPGIFKNVNLEWIASIQSGCRRSRHVCGGVLVSDQHIVTTASCLQRLRCARIVIGTEDLNQVRPQNVFKINRILIHPLKSVHVFAFQNLKYMAHIPDLAIVKLDKKTNFMPICLPKIEHSKYVFHYFNFAGWGENHLSRRSNYKNELVNVKLDNSDCKGTNKPLNVNSNLFLCIKHAPKGPRVCNNDEGGPLMYKVNGIWYAYGILFKRLIERRVDWYNPHCEHNNIGFSVYTKLFDNLYWIRNNLN